jgi:DNA-binding winged helix-turn-helix (wHTH) protein
MAYPAVNFILKDAKKEAEYICFLAKNISSGYYNHGHLFILPKPENNSNVVYFPNLNLSQHFWQIISKTENRHLGMPFPPQAINEVITRISPLETVKDLNEKNSVISWWKNHETQFFHDFSEFLDVNGTLSKINNIDILLTNYGTRGSFDVNYSNHEIYMTHRTYMSPDYLIKTVLLGLLSYQNKIHSNLDHLSWQYQQSFVDMLLSESKFRDLLDHEVKAFDFFDKNSLVYERKSAQYLKTLGFANEKFISLSKDKIILINNHPTDHIFTPQESELLKLFVSHPEATLSFDQIAKTLWPKDHLEKFSLYSITKVIENLRKKIRNQGINKEIIVANRGKGYFLRA